MNSQYMQKNLQKGLQKYGRMNIYVQVLKPGGRTARLQRGRSGEARLCNRAVFCVCVSSLCDVFRFSTEVCIYLWIWYRVCHYLECLEYLYIQGYSIYSGVLSVFISGSGLHFSFLGVLWHQYLFWCKQMYVLRGSFLGSVFILGKHFIVVCIYVSIHVWVCFSSLKFLILEFSLGTLYFSLVWSGVSIFSRIGSLYLCLGSGFGPVFFFQCLY